MNTKLTLMALTALVAVNSAQVAARQDDTPTDVVLASEVTWEQLNPARGDKSPKAGTLWGDRNGTGPTGFLVQFADGFSSPPHIHPITYRAVVISGNIHNDDPDAAEMWMPAGSFWTQPKGEVHITAAKGSINIALVEIDEAPYLVRSFKEAYDSGERPINVDASNIVWVDPPGILPASGGTKIAYLWGNLQDGQSNGTFVKLPAGFTGTIDSRGSTFRAVVIKGQLQYQMPGETDAKSLEPGSYFGSQVASVHQVSSEGGEESIIYVRTDGKYDVIPVK
jgi:hypothetical protein